MSTTRITEQTVKVALVHARIYWKEKERNLKGLLALNRAAAQSGAGIIVNPELSTSGYAFNSRSEIMPLAETIPGPATESLGGIAREYGCYIIATLPELDPATGILYNAAAVLGPDGGVIGKYRKVCPAFRENLWAAEGNLPTLVVDSRFGRFGLVICADGYSFKPVRVAALQGAAFVLMPVNWPAFYNNPEVYWRARAAENGIYVLVCNRTGEGHDMDFRSGESFVIDDRGRIVKKLQSDTDEILYADIPTVSERHPARSRILEERRPACYGQVSLATYPSFSPEMFLELPEAREITAAVVQFQPAAGRLDDNLTKITDLINQSVAVAVNRGHKLDVLVFPELATTGITDRLEQARQWAEPIPGPATSRLAALAAEHGIHIVLGMIESHGEYFYNSSVLIGPKGVTGVYRKVHLDAHDSDWASAGNDFPWFDLPFTRLGMLIGRDLMFPEAVECLAKMGVDLLCVPAAWSDTDSLFIWEARAADQMHLIIANQWGATGRFPGLGQSTVIHYNLDSDLRQKTTSPEQEDDMQLMQLNTEDARRKRFLENVDYDVLLGG